MVGEERTRALGWRDGGRRATMDGRNERQWWEGAVWGCLGRAGGGGRRGREQGGHGMRRQLERQRGPEPEPEPEPFAAEQLARAWVRRCTTRNTRDHASGTAGGGRGWPSNTRCGRRRPNNIVISRHFNHPLHALHYCPTASDEAPGLRGRFAALAGAEKKGRSCVLQQRLHSSKPSAVNAPSSEPRSA